MNWLNVQEEWNQVGNDGLISEVSSGNEDCSDGGGVDGVDASDSLSGRGGCSVSRVVMPQQVRVQMAQRQRERVVPSDGTDWNSSVPGRLDRASVGHERQPASAARRTSFPATAAAAPAAHRPTALLDATDRTQCVHGTHQPGGTGPEPQHVALSAQCCFRTHSAAAWAKAKRQPADAAD